MRLAVTTLVLGALALAAAPRAALAADAPAWVRGLPAPTAAYPAAVPAVVLLNESRAAVDGGGRMTTSRRYAVRLLLREGRQYAAAFAHYLQGSGKVRDMRGWLVRASGEVKEYGKKEIVDGAETSDDVYDEGRVMVISAADEAREGDLFACEWVTEERLLAGQDIWSFQSQLPAVVSRYSLDLPAGWRAEGLTFNHGPLRPEVSGSSYTWELRNLPPIPPEPSAPPFTNVAPRLAVSFAGPNGAALPTFGSWADVSKWVTGLVAPQSTPSDAVTAKARELTAGAKTEADKIRAIGKFVQGVNYISIQTNLARGGGITPHPAADVFAKSYGDCKDKANLMLTMLKAVGIPSYLVSIYSGDPTYVREEWPSPSQFNHCIVAVSVGAETKAASVAEHPSLGRLLVFDPTDAQTPVGDLPDHEQGSLALVVAGDRGGLMRMPETAPEANRLERRTEVRLGADGSVAGRISERSVGQAAVSERRLHGALSRPDYDRRIAQWLAGGVGAAQVTAVTPADDPAQNRFALDVDFTAARYGQLMQGRLLVFRPALVSRLESVSLTEPARSLPVVLDATAFAETATIALPAGFAVDELPDPVAIDAAFGTYATSYEVKDGRLLFTRSLVVRRSVVPVAQYAAVRGFFEKVRAAEQSPVVLVRQ